MQQRLLYIDIAKAIGLCMVILSHTVYPKMMLYSVGWFVPIFFITSGYTTFNIDIAQKAKKLIGSYILYSVILFILFLSIQYIRQAPLGDIKNMVVGILYSRYSLYPLDVCDNIYFLNMEYNAPLWFLTSMFTAYVALMPLLKWPKWQAWIIGAYIILTFLLAQLPILLPWSIDCAPLMAIFIYCGMKMRDYNLLENRSWLLWSIIFIGYCVLTVINGSENLSVRDYGNSIVLCCMSGILGSIFTLKFAFWLEQFKIAKYIAYIGKHSLTIFCLQMPLIVFTRVVIHKLSGALSIEIATAAIALCQLSAAIVGGLIVDLIIRNLAFEKLANKLIAR